MDDIIIHLPSGVTLRFPAGTPQDEIQRAVGEATREGDASEFGAGLHQSDFRGGQLSAPQPPPLLQGAVDRYQQGEQQPPLTFQQADPNWQAPTLGEGIGQLGDVAAQAGIQGAAGLANALRGGTAGLFEQGNAALAGLGTMAFGPEHNFSTGYDWSLQNQRGLMEQTPEELRPVWEMAGAAAPMFAAAPLLAAKSLPHAMGMGATMGLGGGMTYPLATGQGGPEDAVRGGLTGLAIGGAAPPLFAAAGSLGGKVGNMFRRPVERLVDRVTGTTRPPTQSVRDLPATPVQWAQDAGLDDLTEDGILRNAPRLERGQSDISQEYINESRDYYRAVANRLYELADEAGVTIPMQGVMDTLAPLEASFQRQFNPELAASLTARVRHARDILGKTDEIPVSEMERWRQDISRDIRSAEPGSNEYEQLMNIRNMVDDHIEAATATYQAARNMWRTVVRMDVLEDLAHRATISANRSATLSYDEAFVNELRRISRARNDKREWGAFSEGQQQAILDVVNATGPLRGLNQLFSRVFPNNISRSISAGVGLLSNNPLAAVPLAVDVVDRVTSGAARNRALGNFAEQSIPQAAPTRWDAPQPQFMRPVPYGTIPPLLNDAYRSGGGF